MKAVQFRDFGGPDVLEYVDIPSPVPEAGEVLIEVTAAGVNFPDIRERMGVYNRADTRVGGVSLPRVSGQQVVGRVTAVGAGVDRSRIGSKVVALLHRGGGYAEYASASALMALNIPESSNDAEMASLPCQGLTSYLMLRAAANLRKDETVLVHGAAGGVGSLAIQIAKLLGAGMVIATAGSEAKRSHVRALGADEAIAYDDPDWPRVVLAKTADRGADIILESIGGEVFEQNFECLATFGRYIIFGSTRGPGRPVEPRRLMTKAQTMTGFYLPVFFQRPELVREGLEFLVRNTLAKYLKPTIADILPLKNTGDAHRILEDRKAVGVVILRPPNS